MSSSVEIQTIKDRLDVVTVIGQYVQLKPSGINHKGLCPFHKEKSPSFMVNRDRQSWHCFGCAKGGDIFTFIQEIEGMEFVDALKYLADQAGVTLTNTAVSKEHANEKTRLKEITHEAQKFFHGFLTKMPQAADARAYLSQRGLTQETIEYWGIGFAPEQWDLLTQYLLKKGYSIDELIKAGVTVQKEGADVRSLRGFYDRFRGRIMFPISDHHGAVVGFTGRVLVENEHSGGKYVNTPQTALFDKSRLVFGLDRAKKTIRSTGKIVLVEGQMDVIACHQAGMTNVVASSGTALTEEHVKLLSRYATTVAMAFDQDSAGIAAAKRGIEVALSQGLQVKVITIPDGFGKDPDECVKKHKDVWFASVEQAQDVIPWYFDRTFAQKDIQNPRVKQQIADELLPLLLRMPHVVERDHWIRELASRLQTDPAVLVEQTKQMQKIIKMSKPTTSISTTQTAEVTTVPAKMTEDRLSLLVERLLMLVFLRPESLLMYGPQFPDVSGMLSTAPLGGLYEIIKNSYTEANIESLRAKISDTEVKEQFDILSMKAELEFSQLQTSDINKEISLILKEVVLDYKRQKRAQLLRDIEVAERNGQTQQVTELLKQFQTIQ